MNSFALALCLSFILYVQGYIPATPTNDSQIISGAINQSDTSMLQLQWFPNATFSETVSYQLVGLDSSGISEGAFVHFSEVDLTKGTDGAPDPAIIPPDFTPTPWIAFISCDANVTNGSLDVDIFTLARNRGAVSALLYSEWSDACILNQAFADPAEFNKIMDIFLTKSLIATRTVINAFTNVNQSIFGNFNATTLNQSASVISQAIANHAIPEPNYVFAQLTANNASSSSNTSSPGVGGSTTTNGSPKGTRNDYFVYFSLFIAACQLSFF